MTIKHIEEHDSGFGFFFDRELTQEVKSLTTLVRIVGEAGYKKVRVYFGNPDDFSSALSSAYDNKPIVISSSTHPEENRNLGQHLLSGTRHAVEMWFTLSQEQPTEISITRVRWS